MKSKKLSNGFELPVLAIGTHMMGGEDYGPPDFSDDKKYIEKIQQAIKLGYTHIDTAEIYGGGHTEELVGKAINKFNRKKLFLTSKVSKENLRYDDVINSAKMSLKRLGTDYIDLYLIHRPNPDIPIKETMKAMNYLVDNKIIRFIGVSMFNVQQMKEAQKYSRHPIVANQLKLNFWKKVNTPAIRYCQENDIMIIAYKPFGRGLIHTAKIPLVMELSRKYNKTEGQIILKWVVSKKNTVALFKSTSIEHLKENKNIFDFKLTEKEIQKMDGLVTSLFE